MESTIADWERPISNEELQAVEAAESLAKRRRRKRRRSCAHDETTPPRDFRRLPDWDRRRLSSSTPRYSEQTDLNGGFPAIEFGGRVVYCRTVAEVEKATMELLEVMESKENSLDQIALGFDIEWKPTFQKGVAPRKAAVMQICADASNCYVMHIIHSGIPSILQSLLEDPKYVKVGVSIANDAVKIWKDYNVCVKSVEDLSSLANLKVRGDPKNWSLASLTEMLTRKQLAKPRKIRMGNWEVDILSMKQLQYAATDAFVSWHLYQILRSFPDVINGQNMEQGN